CTTISSTICSDFAVINSKVAQSQFDALVQTQINQIKASLSGLGTACDIASNARYIKSVACAFVIKDQGCGRSTPICPSVCTQFTKSLNGIACIQQNGLTQIGSRCSSVSAQLQNCLDYYDMELDSCGFENAAQKASFCATNSNLKCCGGNTQPVQPAQPLTNQSQTTSLNTSNTSTTPSASSTETNTEKETKKQKKEGGSFLTSKAFLIIAGILVLIIAVLGYFYYVGSKDEKEERMRNLESANNNTTYGNNNYGQTQTVEINKTQNLNVNNEYVNNEYTYNANLPNNGNSQYGENQAYNQPYGESQAYNQSYGENQAYNQSYGANPSYPAYGENQPYVDATNNPYNVSYNDVQNSGYQNQDLVASTSETRNVENAENPFDSPKLDNAETDYNSQINKSMQELSKNFSADDMPTPSVVKLTSIEKPQQSNTNSEEEQKKEENPDDMLKPSMVRMTNIETPVPSNTIPADKDISIGDDVLKPSMVKLTEIETPQETSINNEVQEGKENNEADEEPKKAVVNMIDLKSPASNEALNAGNITPSIMVTSTDGKTTTPADGAEGASQQEEITEEYSEMPEPRPFRAIHAYEPQIDDELRLVVDNEIDVLYEYDDGWCWAINKTTGEQGACPLLCLVSAMEEATGEREWEKEMDVMKVPGRRESMLSTSFDTSRLSFQKK
ncbi:hypothetical protein BCR36DRAFT_219225, partial [Piromyces finnis]